VLADQQYENTSSVHKLKLTITSSQPKPARGKYRPRWQRNYILRSGGYF
jgi:hypothetical protein